MPALREAQVVVAGAGIGGLALAFWLRRRGVDVVVLETRDRAGGNLRSQMCDGYLVEWGPNGFLDSEPATLRLVDALGLSDRLVRASAENATRWIVRDRRLRALPSRPGQFLTSDVLSLPGRLRVMLEWAQPARRDPADESVLAFATRRIGREAAEVLVDAMVTGVFAGDAWQLSLQAAFPRMREMEATHGSLVRAMVARAREARKDGSGRAAGSPMGPSGTLTSFRDGIETLPRALADALNGCLLLESPARAIVAVERGGWILHTDAGGWRARNLVLACPAWQAAPLLMSVDPAIARAVAAIQTSPVAVVGLGFAATEVARIRPGFGFLVPGREQLAVLGILFDSWVFADRAPEGRVLWRAIIGGAREPAAVDENDDQLVQRSLTTIDRLLGLRAAPEMTRVIRHAHGIPQYAVGHVERLAGIERALAGYGGLHLMGSSYHGIAMNACIKHGERLSETLAASA